MVGRRRSLFGRHHHLFTPDLRELGQTETRGVSSLLRLSANGKVCAMCDLRYLNVYPSDEVVVDELAAADGCYGVYPTIS